MQEKIRKDGLLLGFRDAETNLISFFLRIGMGFFFGGFSLLDHHLGENYIEFYLFIHIVTFRADKRIITAHIRFCVFFINIRRCC